MRVLLTHQSYPPQFGGGGEYLVPGVARRLLQAGVSVRVFTSGDPKQDMWEGIPVVRLPGHRYRLYLASGTIAELARDADLIQTFTYHASAGSFLAARRTGKPIVCTVLGIYGRVWRDMKGPLAGRAIAGLERRLVTLPYDRTILLSEENRTEALRFGVPESRLRVIEPAIDLDQVKPAEVKDDVVLFAAKLEPRKGFRELIAAARALPHVRFRVMGWGDGEAEMRGLGLPNLEYLGFLKGEDFTREFQRARVFLLPSRAEGFPLVLLHAMAAGCAVVSTLPCRFYGEQVELGNESALIAAVQRLWSDRRRSDDAAARNLELSRNYSWDRHMTALMDTYRELIR